MKDKVKEYLKQAEKIIDEQRRQLHKVKGKAKYYDLANLTDDTLLAFDRHFEEAPERLTGLHLELSNAVYDEVKRRKK